MRSSLGAPAALPTYLPLLSLLLFSFLLPSPSLPFFLPFLSPPPHRLQVPVVAHIEFWTTFRVPTTTTGARGPGSEVMSASQRRGSISDGGLNCKPAIGRRNKEIFRQHRKLECPLFGMRFWFRRGRQGLFGGVCRPRREWPGRRRIAQAGRLLCYVWVKGIGPQLAAITTYPHRRGRPRGLKD